MVRQNESELHLVRILDAAYLALQSLSQNPHELTSDIASRIEKIQKLIRQLQSIDRKKQEEYILGTLRKHQIHKRSGFSTVVGDYERAEEGAEPAASRARPKNSTQKQEKQEKQEKKGRKTQILNDLRARMHEARKANAEDFEEDEYETSELEQDVLTLKKRLKGLQKGSLDWAVCVLGVSKAASVAEAQKKYRVLAKKWHPDLSHENKDVLTEAMSLLNEAWDIFRKKKGDK